ncbi:MAG: polysaccharide biosynthesis/export family protein [Verrucomicrobiota bacterium]
MKQAMPAYSEVRVLFALLRALWIVPCLFALELRFANAADLTVAEATNVPAANQRVVAPDASAASGARGNAVGVVADIESNVVPLVATTQTVKVAGAGGEDSLDTLHKLAIGDRLSFRVVEDEEDPRPLIVTDSGDLEVPCLGRVPVLGKSCKEVARAIKGELEKEYYYQATVIVAVDLKTKSRGKVYLVGSIRVPGPQEIPSDEVFTLSKAILRAGGFGDFANKRHVRLTRKGGESKGEDIVYTVNVTEILEKGRSDTDMALQPGDLIYVPDRLINF